MAAKTNNKRYAAGRLINEIPAMYCQKQKFEIDDLCSSKFLTSSTKQSQPAAITGRWLQAGIDLVINR